jgi:hypothetical protein
MHEDADEVRLPVQIRAAFHPEKSFEVGKLKNN